ncbi:MAG: hypothetical protein HDS87_06110 [Bacteroidales bacterium]|nr:hypothetical protein [Bacteroidales bacterium]
MKFLTIVSFCIASIAIANARVVTYETGLFDHLSQLGDINIIYKSNPDSTGLVTYYSDTDYSDAIEITNTKGKLNIKEVVGHELGTIPTLHAYSDILYQIKSEGKAEIDATMSSATPTLSITLIGNGTITCRNINTTDMSATITTGSGIIALEGECAKANYKLTGTGTIQADRLSAKTVKCTSLGTGTIGCDAQEVLETRGLGSTKIYYTGNPTIKKLGNAKLFPINESENNPAIEEDQAIEDDQANEDDPVKSTTKSRHESTEAAQSAPIHIITKENILESRSALSTEETEETEESEEPDDIEETGETEEPASTEVTDETEVTEVIEVTEVTNETKVTEEISDEDVETIVNVEEEVEE